MVRAESAYQIGRQRRHRQGCHYEGTWHDHHVLTGGEALETPFGKFERDTPEVQQAEAIESDAPALRSKDAFHPKEKTDGQDRN